MRSGLSSGSAAVKGLDTGDMCAVGAGARGESGVTVEQAVRHRAAGRTGGDRFDAVDQCALVAVRKPQQDRGDIAGGQARDRVAGTNATPDRVDTRA